MDCFTSLCKEFTNKQSSFPKTVIYVRTYDDCSSVYMMLSPKVGIAFTELPGYPQSLWFPGSRTVYCSFNNPKKEEVLESFAKKGG